MTRPFIPNSTQAGLVLVVTLLVTAVLTAVITEVIYAVHIHTERAEGFRDGQKASMVSEGGVELAVFYAQEMNRGKGYTQIKGAPLRMAVPEGEGAVDISMEDEQGRFQLNSIVSANGEANSVNYDSYKRLLKSLKLDEGLADTLADWIDMDEVPRTNGAETRDYYKRLNGPYQSKGRSLDTVEELLLVKGYTAEAVSKLKPRVTVYTDGRVNINTAPKEVLSALSADMTEEMAEAVIRHRQREPFKDTAEIRKVAGFETLGFSLQGRISVRSDIFRIRSRGTVGEGIRDIEAVSDTASQRILYWRAR